MNYDLIKDRLRDISFEFKGEGLENEANFIINELLLFVNEKHYQQTLVNNGHKINIVDKTIFDNITIPKKWCMNEQCYCTGDCQRMIKAPVELENLDPLFNITERSEKFSRNSISKVLKNF